MSKTKELIICIVAVVALILSISTNVFATSTDFNALLQNMNTNQNYQTIPNNTPGITELNTNTNTNTNNITPNTTTTNNNTANNNTNTIPYTGVNNFSIIAIIAVCAVVAVYAYKKIRDYNA